MQSNETNELNCKPLKNQTDQLAETDRLPAQNFIKVFSQPTIQSGDKQTNRSNAGS
jgi:hypothetical protein